MNWPEIYQYETEDPIQLDTQYPNVFHPIPVFLSFPLIDTGDTCSDVSGYSVCNTGKSELGTFNSNGLKDGYSLYVSADNPTYEIYYDTALQVIFVENLHTSFHINFWLPWSIWGVCWSFLPPSLMWNREGF